MDHIYDRFLGLPYDYGRGPDVVTDREQAKSGLNCVALIHLIYKDVFNVFLDPSLRAIELYYPNDDFTDLPLDSQKVVGDIVFLSRDGIEDVLKTYRPEFDYSGNLLGKCPFHLAMYIGDNAKGERSFIHANCIDKNVGVWTESRIRSYIRYSTLFALKRSKLLTQKLHGNFAD